ncbi:MAG: hypothetical protein K2R98_08835 [Gemmataceae bacterium]|nr:hypothetical protein [Gemmataceae bacterium]
MKKLVAFLLVVAMVSFTLGCGSPTTKSGTGGAPSSAKADPTTKKAD